MTDIITLEQAFAAQRELQITSYGVDPADLEGPERIQFAKDMALADIAETIEMIDECDWKPWVQGVVWNEEEFKGELVDKFHFFMNLCMASHMSAGELLERYAAKRMINAQRQEDGYDGRSTKCPQCKRALDDPAVECRLVEQTSSLSPIAWCARNRGWVYA